MIQSNMGARNIYERFLWFDSQIRRNRYPNATTLAERFEISRKTAQRDIEFMRDRLNVPLEYNPHRRGYFYTDETFRFPLFLLSSSELTSLLIARKLLEGLTGSVFASDLNRLFSKLKRIITIESDSSAVSESLEDIFSVEMPEHSVTPEENFSRVAHACINRLKLKFIYYSPAKDEITKRTVEPYHLLNYSGTWHLIAYCNLRHAIRDFVIGRMKEIEILDESFTVRRNFNLKKYLSSAFGIFKGASTQQVVLKFSPRMAKWIRQQLWHKEQRISEEPDGGIIISFPAASFTEVKMEVLKYGSDVEVIAPDSLKREILKEIDAMKDIYTKQSS